MVHEDDRTTEFRRDRGHRKIALKSVNVVEPTAAGAEGGAGNLGTVGIDREQELGVRDGNQARHHRSHPAFDLLRRGHFDVPRPGRLAADIRSGPRPSSAIRTARSAAFSGSRHCPPSENESGVTLRIPTTRVVLGMKFNGIAVP